jgi:hypothetical protein
MPEVRSNKGASDGWIVRRMAEIKSASREWPRWVHVVRVSPQAESTPDDLIRAEEALPTAVEVSRSGGDD